MQHWRHKFILELNPDAMRPLFCLAALLLALPAGAISPRATARKAFLRHAHDQGNLFISGGIPWSPTVISPVIRPDGYASRTDASFWRVGLGASYCYTDCFSLACEYNLTTTLGFLKIVGSGGTNKPMTHCNTISLVNSYNHRAFSAGLGPCVGSTQWMGTIERQMTNPVGQQITRSEEGHDYFWAAGFTANIFLVTRTMRLGLVGRALPWRFDTGRSGGLSVGFEMDFRFKTGKPL